jgi:hypothetical protein
VVALARHFREAEGLSIAQIAEYPSRFSGSTGSHVIGWWHTPRDLGRPRDRDRA